MLYFECNKGEKMEKNTEFEAEIGPEEFKIMQECDDIETRLAEQRTYEKLRKRSCGNEWSWRLNGGDGVPYDDEFDF